jgi:glycosyltransferase involved in cell wall biosynthesis
MQPVRVGLICDLREERWHSMDLIADMLMETLPVVAGNRVAVTRLCPPMTQRWTRLPLIGRAARAELGDRLTGRFWDYPRWLAPQVGTFDVFHIVDHSYAHLTRVLPARSAIVTCNDVDAIRAALPGHTRVFQPSRLLASHVLEGLSRAAHIACISQATRDELLAAGRISAERVSVSHLGVHPACSPSPDARSDAEIERRIGPASLEILHVGSTSPRKRLDMALEILRGARSVFPQIKLVRVGGTLPPDQRALAERLGVLDAIVEMPFLERRLLAAVYRRAALLIMPSDREGFGLPVVEAMACGVPVVASDIPALREVGGDAATYCPAGDVSRWVTQIITLLRQRQSDAAGWDMRRGECVAAASGFSWTHFASSMAQLYCELSPARTRAS